MSNNDRFTSLEQSIKREASQCVKCGLCLPHCPTYIITENECESPRGRIALMQGLATKQLPLTEKLQYYLDHCLVCRACELACPSEVKYGQLIDQGRAMLKALTPEKKPLFLLRSLYLAIQHPWLLHAIHHLLRFYQYTGLQQLARKTKFLEKINLKELDALLPPLQSIKTWKVFYPAINKEYGRVALFTGCISNLLDRETLFSAIKMLTMCGYGVYVPTEQRCCSALFLHAGYAKKQRYLMKKIVMLLGICI